jgi:hypothetical protein
MIIKEELKFQNLVMVSLSNHAPFDKLRMTIKERTKIHKLGHGELVKPCTLRQAQDDNKGKN